MFFLKPPAFERMCLDRMLTPQDLGWEDDPYVGDLIKAMRLAKERGERPREMSERELADHIAAKLAGQKGPPFTP
jgi:hypothetical protein